MVKILLQRLVKSVGRAGNGVPRMRKPSSHVPSGEHSTRDNNRRPVRVLTSLAHAKIGIGNWQIGSGAAARKPFVPRSCRRWPPSCHVTHSPLTVHNSLAYIITTAVHNQHINRRLCLHRTRFILHRNCLSTTRIVRQWADSTPLMLWPHATRKYLTFISNI